MPAVMAANIGVWNSAAHPLGLSTKDSLTGGWTRDAKPEDGAGPDKELFGGDPGHHSSAPHRTAASVRGLLTSRAAPPSLRRPPARGDNQKVIEVRNRIFVGGLTEAINEDDLRGLFGRYGHVVEVAIKARGGDQFRGFGFVTFSRNVEAADALRDGSGEVHTLHGRKINVQAAFKRVEKVNSGSSAPPQMPSMMPPPGWMPPPPSQPMGPGGLPPGMPYVYNPYYFGPPMIAANGMWYCGPASTNGMAPPPAYGLGGGGMLNAMGLTGAPIGLFPPGPSPLGLSDMTPNIASLMRQEVDPRCRDGKQTRVGGMGGEGGLDAYQPLATKNSATDLPGFGPASWFNLPN